MDFKYNFPGSAEITLDNEDLDSIRTRGFCMDRVGFGAIANKTWVRTEESGQVPYRAEATIDGDGDLNVTIPRNIASEVTIDQERIKPGNSAEPGIVEHYLGKTGIIRVKWSCSD